MQTSLDSDANRSNSSFRAAAGERISLLIVWIVAAWTLVGAFVLFEQGDAFEGWVGLVSLLFFLFLQLVLPKLADMSNPSLLRNIFSFVMVSSLSVGRYFYLYARVRHFDKSQHVLYGMVIVLFALVLLYRLTAPEHRLRLELHPLLVWLWLVGFAMIVLFIWEVFEYTSDRLFGSDMQDWKADGLSGLNDTMLDLITGFVGAAVVAGLLVWQLARNREKFYHRWISGLFPCRSAEKSEPKISPVIGHLAYVLLALVLYALTARVWQPFYMIKSVVKILLFVVIPLFYCYYCQHDLTWLRINFKRPLVRKGCLRMALLGTAIIAAGFILARPLGQLIDVEAIVAEILTRTRAPHLLVIGGLLYIPLFNASTEELFFRGYLYKKLAQRGSERFASLISASLFAAYHLIVFRSWFNLPLLLAMLVGLLLAGLLLNHLTRKYDSLLPAWILHGLANVSIFAVAAPWFGF